MILSIYSIAKYILARLLFVYRVYLGGNKKIVSNYFKKNTVKKLQIGSGANRIEGWLNSDYFPVRPEVIHIDATRRFPLESNCIDYVFNEHMIEHIPYQAGYHMLGEIHRILKPGGKLRISTPDIQFLINLITKENSELEQMYVDWAANEFTPYADSSQKQLFVVNNFFYNFGHTFIYNKTLFMKALKEAGFSSIKEVEISKSEDQELSGLENETKIPDGFLRLESMIFEATK